MTKQERDQYNVECLQAYQKEVGKEGDALPWDETALSIVKEAEKIHPYKVVGDYDTYSEYNQGWEDACAYIEARLEEEATKNHQTS